MLPINVGIISLLDLQHRHINEENISEVFALLANRIRSMSLIHEKLYQSENVATIDLSDYMTNLTDRLREAYTTGADDVVLNIESESVQIGLDQAIPLGLALNEILTNSFKHAIGKDAPLELGIQLKCEDKDHICLKISDNGPGFPDDFDKRSQSSLGTHLVHILIREQLGGTVETSSDQGAHYGIKFPLNRGS